MQKVLFEEEQSLKQNALLRWIIPPTFLIIILPLLYGLYWQLVMGEPWGDKPMNDQTLVMVSLGTLLVLGFILWLLLAGKLEVKVDTHGIHYRFYPFMGKWKFIPKESVRQYEIKKLGFFERGQSGYSGYRSRLFTNHERMIISGWYALTLQIPPNKKITIGTIQPEQLEMAMKKLMSNPEY